MNRKVVVEFNEDVYKVLETISKRNRMDVEDIVRLLCQTGMVDYLRDTSPTALKIILPAMLADLLRMGDMR